MERDYITLYATQSFKRGVYKQLKDKLADKSVSKWFREKVEQEVYGDQRKILEQS